MEGKSLKDGEGWGGEGAPFKNTSTSIPSFSCCCEDGALLGCDTFEPGWAGRAQVGTWTPAEGFARTEDDAGLLRSAADKVTFSWKETRLLASGKDIFSFTFKFNYFVLLFPTGTWAWVSGVVTFGVNILDGIRTIVRSVVWLSTFCASSFHYSFGNRDQTSDRWTIFEGLTRTDSLCSWCNLFTQGQVVNWSQR